MTDWMDQGACVGYPVTWWYPDTRDQADPYAAARTICQRCPVIAECAEHAIRRDERYGMWGGTAPKERAKRTRPRSDYENAQPTR